MRFVFSFVAFACLAIVTVPARAADSETPYWASLRVDEVNMRVGPGEDYRIMWTYRRKMLPVRVIRLMEGWRLVQDPDGATGWMLARFLSRTRGGLVRGPRLADMREAPDETARLKWRIEPGVVGRLGDCEGGWCQFDVSGHTGFVRQDRLFGAGEP